MMPTSIQPLLQHAAQVALGEFAPRAQAPQRQAAPQPGCHAAAVQVLQRLGHLAVLLHSKCRAAAAAVVAAAAAAADEWGGMLAICSAHTGPADPVKRVVRRTQGPGDALGSALPGWLTSACSGVADCSAMMHWSPGLIALNATARADLPAAPPLPSPLALDGGSWISLLRESGPIAATRCSIEITTYKSSAVRWAHLVDVREAAVSPRMLTRAAAA